MNPYDYFTHELSSPAWHWQIIWYFFVAGIAAGSYITASMALLIGAPSERQGAVRGFLLGLPLVAVGGILLVIDLGKPERFLHMLWYFPQNIPMFKLQSPMSVGGWSLGLFGAFTTFSFLYALVKMNKIKQPQLVKLATWLHEGPIGKVYLVLGMLAGFYLATYTGVLTNTSNIVGWTTSPLIPVLFLASGMSAGMAVMVLMTPKKNELHAYLHNLERADTYMMILELVVLILFVISLGQWWRTVGSGFYGALLWIMVVGLGLVVPLLLKWKPSLLGERTAVVSSVLVIVGGYFLRYVVVMGPQAGHYGF